MHIRFTQTFLLPQVIHLQCKEINFFCFSFCFFDPRIHSEAQPGLELTMWARLVSNLGQCPSAEIIDISCHVWLRSKLLWLCLALPPCPLTMGLPHLLTMSIIVALPSSAPLSMAMGLTHLLAMSIHSQCSLFPQSKSFIQKFRSRETLPIHHKCPLS